MSENTAKDKFEDALGCLIFHFTENKGLLAHLEKGGNIDNSQVRDIEVAFQIIQNEWSKRTLIPKYNVRMLQKVLPRLENCIYLYPERTTEISNLMGNLSVWMNAIFSTPMMSEEFAISVVSQQFTGVPSFCIDLRLGEINTEALEELCIALDTLAQAWKDRESISKIAAGAIITSQELFMTVGDLFSDQEKRQLQRIEQDLLRRIENCLS